MASARRRGLPFRFFIRIKKLGVNTIPVWVPFCVKGHSIEASAYGPSWLKDQQEKIIKERIQKIHQAGLAVFLELDTLDPRCETEIQNKDNFIAQFAHFAEKWAKIAEENQVEFFSPLNEPNFVLRGRENEWITKILPYLKNNFKGNSVLKFADLGPKMVNCSGFDYVAFDIYPNNIQNWPEQLQMVLSKAKDLKQSCQLKGVLLGEVGAMTNRDPYDPLLAGNVFSEPEQIQIFETLFKTTWDKLSGCIINSWSKNPKSPYNIRNKPAEEVVRKWF